MAKIDLDNLPTGIRVRTFKSGKQSIRIHFNYNGIECRETLINFEVTKSNIKYASNLRGEILRAIADGTFNYADYFPNSKRAKIFGLPNKKEYISTLLDAFQKEAEEKREVSTYTPYRRIVNKHLKPAFGDMQIGNLKSYHIQDFIQSLKKTVTSKSKTTGKEVTVEVRVKAKTIRNILIPLRGVVNKALTRNLIHQNPFSNIILKELLPNECFESDYVVDPFSIQEIHTIIDRLPVSERYMVQFWFFTGLRPSELMALEWQDVNFTEGVVHIDRAMVYKRIKSTKTHAGKRNIVLLPPALEALKAQKAASATDSSRIFINPGKNKPWEHDQQLRDWWERVCKKAAVRYRNPYQCRHTYATMLLSSGESVLWIADQMGHVDSEMVIRTYAKKPTISTDYQCKNDWGAFFDQNRPHNTLKTSAA